MPYPHGRVSDSCPACAPPSTDNEIGDDGAKSFAEALKVNATLTQLNVQRMYPLVGGAKTFAGAKAFAEALKVNGTLTELNVYCMLPLPIRKE